MKRIIFVLLSLLSVPGILLAEMYTIDFIMPYKTPEVEGKSLVYTLDIGFSQNVPSYWVHYNKEKSALIVELFDAYIDFGKIPIKIGPLRSLSIENYASAMALHNEAAKILVGTEQEIQYADSLIGKNTIRLKVYKQMRPSQILFISPKTILTTIGVGTCAAILVFFVLSLSKVE